MCERAEVVVAGHICLDIIPTLGERRGDMETFFAPGKLVVVGPARVVTGGAVSNTGLALHRLGVPARLMGKIGDDLFGRATLDVLRGYDPGLAEGMIVAEKEGSSYTVVINPPDVDRFFLHFPGPNHTFGVDDVPLEQLDGACLFHFGYPPLMRRMYANRGQELEMLFRQVRARGLTTSLDMTMPDPESEAGAIDWPALLTRVLPHVDLFLPSLEETLFMLDRERFERMQRDAGPAGVVSRADGALLGELSERLLQLGAAVVGLKLGDQGLYIRTTDEAARLSGLGACVPQNPEEWRGREILAPCFQVRVVGTTGAGDCTIAGFLAGLWHGLPLRAAAARAVAVGACNVEKVDAASGIPSWSALQRRIQSGWEQRPVTLSLQGWHLDAENGIWIGPNDAEMG